MKRIRPDRPLTRLEYQQRYRAKHPATKSKATMAWAKRNPERTRATNTRHRKANAEKRRQAVWAAKGMPVPTRQRPTTCELCDGINANGKALSLDHCHATNKFRGWLCNKCNTGIGKLGDNLRGILRAAAYLEKNGAD
jgi:hypothetical protein